MSDRPPNHHFLDLAYRLARVEALRAHIDAVHDRMDTAQAVRVFQVVETLAGRFVTAIRDESIGLQQARRTDELVRVPPETWARCRAAGAQNAFVQAIELVALLRRL